MQNAINKQSLYPLLSGFLLAVIYSLFAGQAIAGEQLTKKVYAVSGYHTVAYFTFGATNERWLENPEHHIEDGDANWFYNR